MMRTSSRGMLLVIAAGAIVFLGAWSYDVIEAARRLKLEPATVEPPLEAVRAAAEQRRRAEAAAFRGQVIRRAVEHYRIDRELAAWIHDAAIEAGIPPDLAYGLVWVESRFDPRAVSSAGALGIAQVMPATARQLIPDLERTELFEPEINLRIGMAYLRYLIERYEGDQRLALTAYNRGPGRVSRALAAGQEPGNGYASLVMRNRLPLPGELPRLVRDRLAPAPDGARPRFRLTGDLPRAGGPAE
jgi:soluble lytic murein transglycosylase-like protein